MLFFVNVIDYAFWFGMSFNKCKLSSSRLSFLGDMPHLYTKTIIVASSPFAWEMDSSVQFWRLHDLKKFSGPVIMTRCHKNRCHKHSTTQEAVHFPLKLSELSPGFETFVKMIFAESCLWWQDCEKRTILRTLGSACQVSPLRWVCIALPFWLLMTRLTLFCISYSCLKWIKNIIQLKAFLTVSCNITYFY